LLLHICFAIAKLTRSLVAFPLLLETFRQLGELYARERSLFLFDANATFFSMLYAVQRFAATLSSTAAPSRDTQ
jgi:hypothetical protein